MKMFEKIFGKQEKEKETKEPSITAEAEEKQIELSMLREDFAKAEDRLREAALAECRRIFSGKEPSEEEAKAFASSLCGASPKVCGAVGYELAKLQYSSGMSGFHYPGGGKLFGLIKLPFAFFSWAGFKNWGGIAFSICRECFEKEAPRLYFVADSHPYCPDRDGYDFDADEIAAEIRRNSCGIENVSVTVEIEDCERRCRIEFDILPQNNIYFGVLQLQDTRINASMIDEPVIQIPIAGEFFCTFGEVTPDGDVPLHRDNFCMK